MEKHPVILFDGVCNLCNASVNFVIDRDDDAIFRFGALQSDSGARMLAEHGLEPGRLESIVLIDDGAVYVASDAALRIARRLGGALKLLWPFRFVPRFLRDAVYNWIARNRYRWFGRQESCRLPTPDLTERFIGGTLRH
ncbi:MAG: thiol-disulfide oxidoreductase [Bacteroidetes bacterium CG12_big_fil_rev_8_21_14_0_65_60_17]|nr:MAG: thiol-disulfide oxidoreductase [Bacteroidetes bacterium CG12_big_fil_rev_8_21_14_0_65_60_17]